MCFTRIFNSIFRRRMGTAYQNWTLGVDTSHWQGNIDFELMYSKGVRWMINKGTDVGSVTHKGFVDDGVFENIRKAKAAGLLTGLYHWLDPQWMTGVEQAEYFLNNVYNKIETDLPPVLDFEDAEFGPAGKNAMLYKAQEWLRHVEAKTGKIPIVYTSPGYMGNFDVSKSGFLIRYPLWVAHYISRDHPTVPRPWQDWAIWQYNSQGHYPFYVWTQKHIYKGREWGSGSTGLDMNWFKGNYNSLLAFANKEVVVTPPEPEQPTPPASDVLFKAECVAGALTIRIGPGLAHKATGKYLKKGNIVDVFEVENSWFRIGIDQWVSGYPSYMKKLTEPVAPPPEPTPPTPPAPQKPLYKAVVTTTPPNRLRVRKTPNGKFIRWLHSGDIVSVYEEQTDWLRINPNEWISSNPNWVQQLPDEGQVEQGLFKLQLWSQRDPRWSEDRMGSSYITLGQEGCLVTATSSVLNFLGIDTDPKRYNRLLSDRFLYSPPNLMYWQAPDKIWAGKVKREEYKTFYGTGWESTAQAIINSGRPVLAQVDFVPGGAMNQHWVVLIGKINGIWWCYDPWYGSTAALNARYNGIYRIVGYKKL